MQEHLPVQNAMALVNQRSEPSFHLSSVFQCTMLSFTCINRSQNSHPAVVFLMKIYDQCLVSFANFVKGFINW